MNIRGINSAKLRAVRTTLCEQFDIITLSETFLNPNNNYDLKLPGFHDIIRRDRPTMGGGVSIYVKECIAFKRIFECESENLEQIWLQLYTNEVKMLLCNVYRPPNYQNFWELIDNNLENIKTRYANIKYHLIMGDLNADFADRNGKFLNDFCASNNLQILISEPTRITERTQTCLDQILTDMPNFVKTTSVLPPVSNNDHSTVAVVLDFNIPLDKAYSRLVWQYEDGDYEGFRTALSQADWEICFENNDVDTACERWTATFLNLAREYIPNKTILIRPRDSPWYTCALRKLKRKVDSLYKKFKKRKSDQLWERYKAMRNYYQSELDSAEKMYKQSLSDSLCESRNTKQWWKTVNTMLGRGGNDSYPPLKQPDGENYISDNAGKAKLFNDFFLSSNKIDTDNINLPNVNTVGNLELSTIVASEQDVIDQLHALDVNKSTGHDGLSPKLLKAASTAIAPSLTKLINLSLSKCKVPNIWKKANVIPIYKKGDKDIVNNYRPISILPVLSKVLERIVFKSVYNYLHEHNLLSTHQSGFRPGDSTVNQLAYMYHQFCEALDKKKDVRIVFCDISKAFDKVWHQGIIFKLKKLGINGDLLKWFQDYLDNRFQSVVIKGQVSWWSLIEAGVPQGSVLGPLLFLIYINDLAESVNCSIKMFADDTCLYITVEDPAEGAELLNHNLSRVHDWAKQ